MPAPWARVARVVIKGRIHGHVTNNVMHFATNQVVNDGSQLDELLLALAFAMLQCVVDLYLPAASSDWSFEQVTAQNLYPALTDPVVSTAPANTLGTNGAANVGFVSSMVNIRTGIGGRRGRGKMFLPPCGDANITNGIIAQTVVDDIVAFLECVRDKFMGAGATEPWRLGILSQKDLSELGGTFDNSFREATQLTPQTIAAAMRSRKLGVGA